MSRLIVFYSRSGHNRQIANELKNLSQAEIEEIVDEYPKGFIISGWQAITKKKTTITAPKSKASDYDMVILVSPMWVGGAPPAMRTYIQQYLDKKDVAFVSVSGNGIKNDKFVDDLEFQYGLTIKPRFHVADPDFAEGNYKENFKKFAGEL